MMFLDFAQRVEAVAVRQRHIEDQQVPAPAGDLLQRSGDVAGLAKLPARKGLLQELADAEPRDGVVIGDQDSDRSFQFLLLKAEPGSSPSSRLRGSSAQ